MGNAPVGQRSVLCQNVVDAAGNQALGSAADDVKVGDDKDRCAHGSGFLLPVDDGRADVGGETVRGGQRRDGNKGNAQLVGGVAAEVHDGAGADGDDHLGGIQILHHLLDEDILSAKTVGIKDDVLVGLDMLALGQLPGDLIVDHRALAGKAQLLHVLFKMLDGLLGHDDLAGLKGMRASADAFAGILFAIHDHGTVPPFSYGFTWKVYHIRRCHTSGETQNPKQVFPVKFHKRERCTAKKLGES